MNCFPPSFSLNITRHSLDDNEQLYDLDIQTDLTAGGSLYCHAGFGRMHGGKVSPPASSVVVIKESR